MLQGCHFRVATVQRALIGQLSVIRGAQAEELQGYQPTEVVQILVCQSAILAQIKWLKSRLACK